MKSLFLSIFSSVQLPCFKCICQNPLWLHLLAVNFKPVWTDGGSCVIVGGGVGLRRYCHHFMWTSFISFGHHSFKGSNIGMFGLESWWKQSGNKWLRGWVWGHRWQVEPQVGVMSWRWKRRKTKFGVTWRGVRPGVGYGSQAVRGQGPRPVLWRAETVSRRWSHHFSWGNENPRLPQGRKTSIEEG